MTLYSIKQAERDWISNLSGPLRCEEPPTSTAQGMRIQFPKWCKHPLEELFYESFRWSEGLFDMGIAHFLLENVEGINMRFCGEDVPWIFFCKYLNVWVCLHVVYSFVCTYPPPHTSAHKALLRRISKCLYTYPIASNLHLSERFLFTWSSPFVCSHSHKKLCSRVCSFLLISFDAARLFKAMKTSTISKSKLKGTKKYSTEYLCMYIPMIQSSVCNIKYILGFGATPRG